VVSPQITLRPLEESDLELLWAIRHHPETLPRLHDPRVFGVDQVRQWYADQRPPWLIVEAMGRAVGYVRISDPDPAAGRVKIGMDIDPAVRRRGIATAAYEALFHRLRHQGFREVWLEVLVDNVIARSLYERLGFTYASAGRRLVERGGEPSESLAMSRDL
jgi:RimJ/RimL family protein N-acetyltransferase